MSNNDTFKVNIPYQYHYQMMLLVVLKTLLVSVTPQNLKLNLSAGTLSRHRADSAINLQTIMAGLDLLRSAIAVYTH